MPERLCVIANPGSGLNSRDSGAIAKALAVFGDRAFRREWQPGSDLGALVDEAIAEGADTIVAAGGDGTVVATAAALIGKPARLGVLPLGTFNFFARGLGLPEDPEAAARAILGGKSRRIAVGMVNGQIFLNNASIGIYPRILRARETTYRRFGRSRLFAYWSVVKTFWNFQRARRIRLEHDGEVLERRSPLLFVARSAYQLEHFGLEGQDAISDDQFAAFLAYGENRADLFAQAFRLVTGHLRVDRHIDLFTAPEITVTTGRRRELVAFDGEKTMMATPLHFSIRPDALEIVIPSQSG